MAAAGAPNFIESLGFHVWSLGRLVPGEVCRAEVVGSSTGVLGGFPVGVVGVVGVLLGALYVGLLYFAYVLNAPATEDGGTRERSRCDGCAAGRSALAATWASIM